TRLADAPGFQLNLACGDSLLHAPLRGGQQVLDFELTNGDDECEHAYQSEDLPVLKRLLRGGQYHAVVANPPYITPKDAALNSAYRERYSTCYRQYSLAVPFLERIVSLNIKG
ncbi:MAG: Eco57I restriction-modification methylase domain-containing protein, partial [Planctomycetota bacterium]